MNVAKVIRQLQEISDETVIAAGKFVPRGVVAHRFLKSAGAGVLQLFYVGVTDSEVLLFKGTSRMMVAPARPGDVLIRWPRSEVKVIPKRGLVNPVTEFHVPGVDRPIALAHRRLDASAKNVVRLLSAQDHAHDRMSPIDSAPH